MFVWAGEEGGRANNGEGAGHIRGVEREDVQARGSACGKAYDTRVRRDARAVCAVGFLFCCALGAVSHFFYEWSGEAVAAGIFFPANESVWEHMKLVFFPFAVYFALALPLAPRLGGRTFGAFAGTYVAAAVLPCVFYTYTAFTGRAVLGADITTFVAGTAAGMLTAYRAFTRTGKSRAAWVVGAAGIAVMVTLWLTLTLCAPDFFLFTDPVTGGRGMSAHGR